MNYVSFTYLFLFLTVTFIVYQLVPLSKRWVVILCASILFYLTQSTWLIVFVVISALSVYYGALKIDAINLEFKEKRKGLSRPEKKELREVINKRKKKWLKAIIWFNLAFIIVLKYGNFIIRVINFIAQPFSNLHINFIDFFLPVGISFYTLMAISYVIDVSRGKYQADHHFGRLLNYLLFFPTVIEGPIGRYDEVAYSIHEGHPFNYQAMSYGFQRILWGLFKKLIVADRANMFVNTVFNVNKKVTGLPILIAIIVYTIQLYADFSGGMDIAIGSAEMFGIFLPENFNQPFYSTSVNEFWRRWHMTLGSWLRDYVLYSVTLSPVFKKISKYFKERFNPYFGRTIPVIISLFCVWTLMGLWHGTTIKYVIYGLYYYFIMVIGMLLKPMLDKCVEKIHLNREAKWYIWFSRLRTFIIVNIGMMIFRVERLSYMYTLLKRMFINFSLTHNPKLFNLKLKMDYKEWLVFLIGVLVIIIIDYMHEKGIHIREIFNKKPIFVRYCTYFVIIFVIFIFGAYGYGYNAAAFLYGAF